MTFLPPGRRPCDYVLGSLGKIVPQSASPRGRMSIGAVMVMALHLGRTIGMRQ